MAGRSGAPLSPYSQTRQREMNKEKKTKERKERYILGRARPALRLQCVVMYSSADPMHLQPLGEIAVCPSIGATAPCHGYRLSNRFLLLPSCGSHGIKVVATKWEGRLDRGWERKKSAILALSIPPQHTHENTECWEGLESAD